MASLTGRFRQKSDNDNDDQKNLGAVFLSSIYNLSKSVRAWRTTSLVLACAFAFTLYMIGHLASEMPVRLIPYDYAINKGVSKVPQFGVSSPEYLSNIAISDISLYSNWTPSTIKKQYRRFLNRCAPELYAGEQTALINKADKLKSSGRSRAFFPRSTSVQAGQTVVVVGQLRRYEGDSMVSSRMVRYSVDYRVLHGVPYIHRIVEKDD